MNRICKKCHTEKPLGEFQKNKTCREGRTWTCRACFTIYQKQWTAEHLEHKQAYHKRYYQENHVALKMKSRRQHLGREYDITPEQYEEMHKAQGGVCGICGGTNARTGRLLDVDHDHTTGKIRSLLCNPCNTMLGHAKDSIDTLQKAIAYLEKHG